MHFLCLSLCLLLGKVVVVLLLLLRRAREDDISSDGEESNPEVDFARDDDVLLR